MIDAYKKPYVIGMDGGGTKTKICVMDLEGHEIDVLFGGGMNINGLGREGVLRNMASMFTDLKSRSGDWSQMKSLCIGAAGISNPDLRDALLDSVKAADIELEPIILGDHHAALYGAHGQGKGMILIAGTGSMCFGMDGEGGEARTGGRGYLIDDEGSGYALGRDVLSAIAYAEDGRIPPTCMREAVFKQLGIDNINDMIKFVYADTTGKREIAALAPNIMLGLAAGEKVAFDAMEKAAEKLAEMVGPVVEKLQMQKGELAFCGSVITKNEVVIEKLKNKLHAKYPELQCISPKQDAAFGSALRALEEA